MVLTILVFYFRMRPYTIFIQHSSTQIFTISFKITENLIKLKL
jgi:hypothetical protein